MATISVEGRNEALDALLANVDGGLLRIYTGSAPSLPTDAATGTLLAELTLSNPAFAAASGGVATANSVTSEDAAPASGTAGYARLTKSGGTGVIDLLAGGSLRTSTSNVGGKLTFTTTVAHGFSNDATIHMFIEAGGVLPTGITENVTYYVRNVASTTFELATSAGGTSINYTDAGTNYFRVKSSLTECALASSDASIAAGVQVSVASMTFRM